MSKKPRLPVAVVALGVTSFFTDVGTELIFPLLPVFLATLGASPTFIGLIEGLADATSSILKLGAGWVADRTSRRKPLVVLGYAIATLSRPLVALATAPWHVLAVRVTDRVGKGIRTSPRDALIAAAAPEGGAGRAFGFHSAMDHAGAVVGPLLATLLLSLGLSLRNVFALSLVPGLLAVASLGFVRESRADRAPISTPAAAPKGTARPPLSRSLRGYLAILFCFSLGNSSDAFLLLRARELGVSVAAIPILWTVLNASKLSVAYVGGSLSDRVPRVRLIIFGWGVYALTYLGMGLTKNTLAVWALFAFYGVYHGLTEPAEKALVKDLSTATERGRAYGAYHFVVGIAAVPAGALAGYLWQKLGPSAAFGLGAGLALLAGVLLLVWEGQMPRGSAAPE